MNKPSWFLTGLLIPLFSLVTTVPGHGAADAAGYWEGEITLPNGALQIGVELVRGTTGPWSGNISIPAQGLRGYGLTNITVKGAEVAFAMPGIPGDPAFKGALAPDGKAISGDFTQGGQTLAFKAERRATKPKPPGIPTPAKGVPGKGMAGAWQGSLKPVPNTELRLALDVTNAAAGKLGGTLVSVDQGDARIPITEIIVKDTAVSFEVPRVSGSFTGKMSSDGSEIVGEWAQGGGTIPLVLKRLPSGRTTGP